MTHFNPDNANSLEIKQDIRDMTKQAMNRKDKGAILHTMYKMGLKDAAEEYALARNIQPHTNLKLLQAKASKHPKMYLCNCGEQHAYEDTADEYIINALEMTLNFFIAEGLQKLETRLPFYTSAILCERIITYLKLLITSIKEA